MKTRVIFSAALLFCSLFASAHAIWIETDSKGIKGKSHSARIFFGEFAENERDTVANWFSNLKDVQLYVTAPDGSKQRLSLTNATDHYEASFTPEMDGAYTVSLSHTVGEVYGNAKIEYYATATVLVGSAYNEALKAATTLGLQPAQEEIKNNKETLLIVFNDNKRLPGAKVVISSDQGWVKTVQSGADGSVVFTPLIRGRYQLEAVRTDKTPGTHNGKPYQSVTHLVTHCINVR